MQGCRIFRWARTGRLHCQNTAIRLSTVLIAACLLVFNCGHNYLQDCKDWKWGEMTRAISTTTVKKILRNTKPPNRFFFSTFTIASIEILLRIPKKYLLIVRNGWMDLVSFPYTLTQLTIRTRLQSARDLPFNNMKKDKNIKKITSHENQHDGVWFRCRNPRRQTPTTSRKKKGSYLPMPV